MLYHNVFIICDDTLHFITKSNLLQFIQDQYHSIPNHRPQTHNGYTIIGRQQLGASSINQSKSLPVLITSGFLTLTLAELDCNIVDRMSEKTTTTYLNFMTIEK